MARELTTAQASVLRGLRSSATRTWSRFNPRFVWETPSRTESILRALVRKGLVENDTTEGVYRPTTGGER